MTTRTETGATPGVPGAGSAIETTKATETSRVDTIGGVVTDAAGTVRSVASDAAARLPEVAATTRTAIEDANRQLRDGSDEMLTVGSALSFGLAGGLLLGGASRFIVAVALLPAAMMALAMLERSSRARVPGGRRMQGA
jgi:hypothetical protein